MPAPKSPSPWRAVRSAVRGRPTIAFFLAAFVLTWIVWVPRALVSQGLLDAPWVVELGATWAYGPAEAALLVAALIGRDALRDLGRRLTRWRVPLRWYAVVLLGPAAFWAAVLVVVGVLGLLGIPYDGEAAPQPTGPTVVLLHGGGLDGARLSRAAITPRVAEHPTVIAPDFPGFGVSPMGTTAPTVIGYADWLVAFLDALGVRRCLLAGLSLGGAAAIRTALDVPDRVADHLLRLVSTIARDIASSAPEASGPARPSEVTSP